MCGIVSLVYESENPGMGKEAEALLRRLEYRGYDSTGASFIDADKRVSLYKRTGAPSVVCPALGIAEKSGQRFLGQVRWATYGAVTDINSQPHHVHCRLELVGAHNGNISNTDSLKAWLSMRGHAVISDNDGEMLIHLVEEHYAAAQNLSSGDLAGMRQAYAASGLRTGVPDGILRMVDALRKAEALAEGSYAAAIVDPRLPGIFAMKSGSSLYAGVGSDAQGDFIVVSSDLTSVLSKTRSLIPLAEGEGLWFTHDTWLVFNLRGAPAFSRPKLKRSKLSVRDTQLDPRHAHYMEQEIMGAPDNLNQILRYYFRDPREEGIAAVFEERKDECKESANQLAALAQKFDVHVIKAELDAIFSSASWASVLARLQAAGRMPDTAREFISDEAELLSELQKLAPERSLDCAVMDQVFIWRKRRAVLRYLGELKNAILETANSGGRIYLVASGTSYHAALTAACFFNRIARMPVYPCNPGMFRSLYFNSLRDDDLLVGITQSGETKDLVDIFQDIRTTRPSVRRACLVNNENSRIPQELSDFYLPILCGPEIAVAATKSFVNQLAILYLVASNLALPERVAREKLTAARKLMKESLSTLRGEIEEAALRLHAVPSMHILGTGLLGLAKEGALKIREVVLNHTEGYDSAEFKHGPNTILGKNTILSLSDLEVFLEGYLEWEKKHEGRVPGTEAAGSAEKEALSERAPVARSAHEILARNPALIENLYCDYPLVFICPPEDRDVRITISQIHTHKIRGADIILIAERRQDLALAVGGKPGGSTPYWSEYIEIPNTGDPCLFVFGATVVLQYLAYRMSVLKMGWLDGMGISGHGVHPDAPKNVSKSITVD